MINASVYFFGNFDGRPSAYPQDNTFKFFSRVLEESTKLSQLFVQRENNLMYYAYVRRLNIEPGHFLGMCMVVNDVQFSSHKELFKVFEEVVGNLVSKATIIGYTKYGSLIPLIKSWIEFKDINTWMNSFQISFGHVKAVKLPPLRYSDAKSGIEKLSYTEVTDEQFLSVTAGNQLIQISKKRECDTPGMTRQRTMLLEQSKEIDSLTTARTELLKQVTQLKREKKQFKWVVILLLTLLAGGAIAINVHNKMSDEIAEQSSQIDTQSHHISQQNVTIDELGEEVDHLSNERTIYKDSYDQAVLKISELETDIQNLQDENQNLEQAKDEAEASAEYWKEQYFNK